MKLTVRARHLDVTPETLEHIRQGLYAAFARISPWIRAVDVTISDINGPKGGADKHCRLRIRGRSIPSIVVEQLGLDTLATIAAAAERGEQAVIRKLSRRRLFAPVLSF